MKSETREEEFAYHAHQKAPYFEGWYIKTVGKEDSLALIIGISKTEKGSVAFIQTNSTFQPSTYETFQEAEVKVKQDPFLIQLGRNAFCKERLILHLACGLHCDLKFHDVQDIKRSAYMPTIMGPFAYYRRMECIHAIISLRHLVEGEVWCKDHKINFDQAIGYMEKDRGSSFPSSYVWYQSNHAKKIPADFFLSIAKIPIGPLSFTGCIAILKIKDQQYRFASYLGCHVSQHQQTYLLKQYPYKLLIRITSAHGQALKAPQMGKMDTVIYESLDAQAIVHLYHHKKRICSLHFDKGGYELH